jgi:hypothetical protein
MEVRGYESRQPYVTWDQVPTYQVEQYRIYWPMGFPRMGRLYFGETLCPLLVCRLIIVGPFLST